MLFILKKKYSYYSQQKVNLRYSDVNECCICLETPLVYEHIPALELETEAAYVDGLHVDFKTHIEWKMAAVAEPAKKPVPFGSSLLICE